MKKNLIIFLLLLLPYYIRAELLIFEKNQNNGYLQPLNQSTIDKHGDQIGKVILKYQWPMSTGKNITEEEQAELFAPEQHAEERFIQKKLQQILQTLEVVFIPTCIAELFYIAEKLKDDPQYSSYDKLWINNSFTAEGSYMHKKDFFDIDSQIEPLFEENQEKHRSFILQKLFEIFNRVNLVFYQSKIISFNKTENKNRKGEINPIWKPEIKPVKTNPYIQINSKLTQHLYKIYNDLSKMKNNVDIFNHIKNNIEQTKKYLIDNIISIPSNNKPSKELLKKLFKEENRSNIISQTINLEYQAHTKNNAILLRGTNLIKQNLSISQTNNPSPLSGTTIHSESLDILNIKNHNAYTIPFGNSLFAGLFNDTGACAYYFLNGVSGTNITKELNTISGYCIYINKQDYYSHHTEQLFFIPPLSTLASLFEQGEFFHSRSKIALNIKNQNEYSTAIGFASSLSDNFGIYFITRDPLKHAEIFSKYLSQHSKPIYYGQNTSPEEESQILNNQSKAAGFYHSLKVIKNKLNKKGDTLNQSDKQSLSSLIDNIEKNQTIPSTTFPEQINQLFNWALRDLFTTSSEGDIKKSIMLALIQGKLLTKAQITSLITTCNKYLNDKNRLHKDAKISTKATDIITSLISYKQLNPSQIETIFNVALENNKQTIIQKLQDYKLLNDEQQKLVKVAYN